MSFLAGRGDTPGRPDLPLVARRAEAIRREQLPGDLDRLKPLFSVLAPPAAADWLANHREHGQTVAEFRGSTSPWPRSPSGYLGLVLVGSFTPAQRQALEGARAHLQAVFGLPTRILAEVPDRAVRPAGRRKNPRDGRLQFHTRWIYEQLLKPRKAADCGALLGFTATDLYPDRAWNFVFGIAYPSERIGLWSVARFGDPAAELPGRPRFLERTVGTATHETAHLFGLNHCIAYECLMNGADSLEESDRHPLLFCPSCQAKLGHLTGLPVLTSLQRQREACLQAGLTGPAQVLQRLRARLEPGGTGPNPIRP